MKPSFGRLDICRKAYLSQSINLWNNLDASIIESKSFHTFKFKVKLSLLEKNQTSVSVKLSVEQL